jgi:hypothetical protein
MVVSVQSKKNQKIYEGREKEKINGREMERKGKGK